MLAIAAVGLPVSSFFSGRRLARGKESRSRRYWIIAIRSVMLSALVLFSWMHATRPLSALGLDVPVSRAGQFGLIADLAILGYYVSRLQFANKSQSELAATRDRLRRLGAYEMLPRNKDEFAIFPIAAIAGSTFEELLYRGFLIGLLTPRIGIAGAVFSSSVLFGCGHAYQGVIGVVRTMLIGLAFGVGFALTHSLWWLMIAHSVANVSGVMLARRLLMAPDGTSSAPAPAEHRIIPQLNETPATH